MTVLHIKKKPVVVQAMQYTGEDSVADLRNWGANMHYHVPDDGNPECAVWVGPEDCWVNVPLNHYVIKGVRGEHYPIADDILEETYDIIKTPSQESIELLEWFVDYLGSDCRYDHHGYCQEHALESDCTVARTAQFIKDYK